MSVLKKIDWQSANISIDKISLIENDDYDNFRKIEFGELSPSAKAGFSEQLLDFVNEEYQNKSITQGAIEIQVMVNDNDSAIIYGKYQLNTN